jgi:hypothetical protein
LLRFLLAWLLLSLPVLGETPPIITREQWGSKPQPLAESLRHQPRIITIHHSGVLWKNGDDPYVKIRALQSWGQKEKNWPDLPYHYLIAPSGQIFEGRDWHYRPESNTQYDLVGVLNVELWGNFDEQLLTLAQLRSLVDLLGYLCSTHHLSPAEIRGHGDAAPGQTHCPGVDVKRYLTSGALRRWTEQILAGQHPPVELMQR